MNDQYFTPTGSYIDLSEYSSNIQDMTKLDGGRIRVTFKRNGAVYDYFHCPPTMWEIILKGATTKDGINGHSIGAAFHQHVISAPDLHPFERIS